MKGNNLKFVVLQGSWSDKAAGEYPVSVVAHRIVLEIGDLLGRFDSEVDA